jgi:hypothetical protein
MEFNDAQTVEELVYSLRSADLPRSSNRARINDLFNGIPPYTDKEAVDGKIEVNVNFLEPTRIGHDARSQFYGAFLKPGNYFSARTDLGPAHKKAEWSSLVTRAVNKRLKRSLAYYECFRSKFASDVLHGVGPSVFRDSDRWCPRMLGVEDVLLPGNTELVDIGDDNLPYFALHQTWTAPQLMAMTRGEKRDPGWNMDLVESVIEWVDKESAKLMGGSYADLWSPEKTSERVKGDGSSYAADYAPSIDVYDFYFYSDEGRQPGWRRRVILDAYTSPRPTEKGLSRRSGNPWDDSKNAFLYDGKNRRFAEKMTEIVNFQFADLSAVAPFRYHTVRSLGFLLYSVCHLQNRLRCAFTESVFESLMMLFRVRNEEDIQRALNVTFANRGFVDSQIQFIPQQERWNPNHQLVQLGLQENARLITQHSNAFTTSPTDMPDKREKTATQVMAEVQKTTQLVAAGLMQAYHYQVFEYREIFRRFCKKSSRDRDVKDFRKDIARAGVPEQLLDPDAWEIEPERVMGAGNKTLEVAIANQLMAWRPMFDAGPQRQILRDAALALTDDPDRANALVPETPIVSQSVQHAQYAAGTLMDGIAVNLPDGINLIEYIEALLAAMASVVQRVEQQQQGVPEADELLGLQMMGQHIGQTIAQLAQNEAEKPRARHYMQQLGELMNLVKAFGQRLAEKQQAQNAGMDPKLLAQIQAEIIGAQTKAKLTETAHAQRTAQRQAQWEMAQEREKEEFARTQERKDIEIAAEVRRKAAVAAVEAKAKSQLADIQTAKAKKSISIKRNERGQMTGVNVEGGE